MNFITISKGLRPHQLTNSSTRGQFGKLVKQISNQSSAQLDDRRSKQRQEYRDGFVKSFCADDQQTSDRYPDRQQKDHQRKFAHQNNTPNHEPNQNRKPNYQRKFYEQSPKISHQQFDKQAIQSNHNKHFNYEDKTKVWKKKEMGFGRLSNVAEDGNKAWLESEFLEDDPDHMERMEVVTEKRPRNYYLFAIKEAIYTDKKLGVKKALELYREMQLDRKKINSDFYKMLIKGCAIVGYVEKAFELYAEYLQIEQLPLVHHTIVTSLFNCCSNSPDKQLGLERAKELYDGLKLQGFNFNLYNYNCLIKTFGMLGDLETAFAFFDMIIQERFYPNVCSFNNLLIGCCSNQAQGLSLATNIIQAMRFIHVRPDIYTYNLLYRITRDCHFGSEQDLEEQVKRFGFPDAISSEFLREVLFKQRALLKRNLVKQIELQQKHKQIEQKRLEQSSSALLPAINELKADELMCLNFLGSSVGSVRHYAKIVNIDYESLSQPENRLKLIGGQDLLFDHMQIDNVRPNIKTISLLTSLVPPNEKDELKLIKQADKLRIPLDTDFFNMLIRRANIRDEPDVAKKYLKLMTSRRLAPNIQTYGVMAIACCSSADIKKLLYEMDEFGVRPNEVIMDKLIKNAAFKFNFHALAFLVRRLSKYGIKPTHHLIETLALTQTFATCWIEDVKEDLDPEKLAQRKKCVVEFKSELKHYLTNNPNIENEDPLEQYKTEPIPRNEEFHKFKVQMTKLLREKKRYMNEVAQSAGDEPGERKM